MTHLDPEVAAAAALEEPLAAEARRHLEQCQVCQAEVAAIAAVIGTARSPVELTPPPGHVWSAIERAIDADETATAPGAPIATTPPALDRRPRSRWQAIAPWAAAAALAGIVVGGLGVRALEPDETARIVSRATLDTLDTKQRRGEADVESLDGALTLRVTTPRMPAGASYYEVWLINTDLKRMVSVGVLAPERRQQSFQISQQLLDEGYTIVDVSREPLDDKPAHSGDSLMRGTLA